VLFIQERVEPVTAGVLEPVLLADPGDELNVSFDLVLQRDEPVAEFGFDLSQPLIGVRIGGIHHRARRQDERE
jgi:hypothetical protein